MNPAGSPSQDEPTERSLGDEYDRLRRENRRRFRRRMVTVGVVLLAAAGVEWRRQIGVAIAGRWYAAKSGGSTIDAEAAVRALDRDAVLILDVRSPEEYAVSHLRGARSLPLARLRSGGWPQGWPVNRPIIAYCTVGYRSGLAVELLAQAGLEARNLRGGILAVAQAGEPLVDAAGETRRVHTWSESLAWMLPADYEATWSSGGGE